MGFDFNWQELVSALVGAVVGWLAKLLHIATGKEK
jgi:hypothetical protein